MRDNERQGPSWQYPPTRLERPYVFAHARLNLCQGTKLALYRFPALYSGKNFHWRFFDAIATVFNWPKFSQLSVVYSSS